MEGILATQLGPLAWASIKKTLWAVLVGSILLLPVFTYFKGKSAGREELLAEIAEANQQKSHETAKENVRRTERAITGVSEKKTNTDKRVKEFEDAVDSNPTECSCTPSDDELRAYNEIVSEANRHLPGGSSD